MSFRRLINLWPVWVLVPVWFFAIGSLILSLNILAVPQGADFTGWASLPTGTIFRWFWSEVVLLLGCFIGMVLLRLHFRNRILLLAHQAAKVAHAAPNSFRVERAPELKPVADALAKSAQYVQGRLLASKQNEDRARQIVNSNMLGMAFWRKDGLFTEANDAFLGLTGYSRSDLNEGQLGWSLLIPEDQLPLSNHALEEIKLKGTCTPYEIEYLHRSGHRLPVLVAAAKTDDTGEEGVCFVLDRTDAKRSNAALTRRVELEHLIATFSARLISVPCEELTLTIDDALAEFGTLSGISGTSVFLFVADTHGQQLHRAHQWQSPNHVQAANISRLSPAVLRGLDRLRSGEAIESYSLSEENASDSRDGNRYPQLRTEVAVPLICGGSLTGVLTIQSYQYYLALSEDDLTLFRLLGQMIASGIDRLRADAALRESEETKRAVWESSLDGIITMDASGCIQDWNPAAEKIFGFSREEVAGQILAEKVIPEQLRKQHDAGLRRFLASRKSAIIGSRLEIQALRKDGTQFPCELSIMPVERDGEEPVFIGTVRDITERRENEERLRTSQVALQHAVEQTRTVLDALPARVALFDESGAIVVTNQVWQAEGAPEWMLPKLTAEAVEVPPILPRILDVAAGHLPKFTLEYAAHTSTAKRWYRVMAEPLADRSRGAVVMHMDITEHQLAVDALAESEERYRSLVENAREAIFTLGSDATVITLNPAFSEITGYARTEWIGRTFNDFLHPDDVERARGLFSRVLTGEIPAPFQLRARHSDGRVLEFECTAVPQRLNGEIVGILGVARDVTERNRLEERLRLAERMDSVGQLAAGVAHDFNNILTIQQSYASELAELEGLTGKAQDAIAEITAAGERAALLTRKLLAFGRKQAMQPRPLDCNEFLRGMATTIERLLGDDIAYTLNAHSDLPYVYIDANMLEQVIAGLVTNSHDAMPDGGALVISTEIVELNDDSTRNNPEARSGSFVQLTVTDTGCGIPPEHLQHIFEPFFTTKDVARGSGMGLATAHGIVKQNNGWIEVESRLNAGTSFRIYLPTIKTQQPAIAATQKTPAPSAIKRAQVETILVAEDEVQLCTIVSQFLKRRGYNVLTANSGVEALKVWQEYDGHIDLLLTDLVMPEGMTGKELADRLLEQRPDLRVIYTSGYSPEIAGCDLSLRAGFNFLPKPYQPAVLAKVVRECLDKELQSA